ncbi:septum site-determining protein MinC [Helicobacter marmotae]|uniref:Septum site-determining protein MinC n=1 Tax=Helicobacter marmotae TaxID=152490 RepID=A0A3D8I2Y9_9HELI|nr:septum site-determining protein MinC [Helicobacter marmotae]RDU59445.1 septum site-determining protein MinC [Helicobacter marmotae]
MIKTRQRTMRVLEFEGNVDIQECKEFVSKHLPLLQNHVFAFQAEISQELIDFLQEQGLSVAVIHNGVLAIQEVKKEPKTPPPAPDPSCVNTLWLHRVVRSGEEICTDGDMVIESRINSGARIICGGNLFLFGECYGHIEGNGDFIICRKIFAPALLFQGMIIDRDVLHKINQSSALFKMIFKEGDNILTKDIQ